MAIKSSTRPRRERLSRAERSRRILAAAVEVFGKSGFRDGSLLEVAEAAGMTVPGLLHYYPSKVDLLFATLAEWQQLQSEANAATGQDSVLDSGRAILARNMQQPGMMRLRVTLTAESTSPSHPAHERMVQRYREVEQFYLIKIQNDAEQGFIEPPSDPRHIARALVTLLDGLQLQMLLNPEIDALSIYETAAAQLLRPISQS